MSLLYYQFMLVSCVAVSCALNGRHHMLTVIAVGHMIGFMVIVTVDCD
jgi:hypothetical protein